MPSLCVFDPAPLQSFTKAVLEAMGADPEVAAEVSEHLVLANLSGHDSHGVLRLTQYVSQADLGSLAPAARPEIVHESGAVFVVDGHRGFGHFATAFAMREAVERARRQGVSAGVVRHATHIGRLGHYTEQAARQNLAALVTVGAAGPDLGTVVPFGGVQPFLGTNPWSMGVPADGRPPMIFDAATSAVAEGKVRLARAKHAQLPEGALLDAAGNPTTEPAALYDGGALLPVGGWAGHKGYGLGLASALLGGLAMVGDSDPTMGGASSVPAGDGRIGGVFLVAIDPAHFGDPAAYMAMVSGTLDAVKRVRPARGVEEVLVPGEPELRMREARRREGVAVPDATRVELVDIGERFGVQLPECRPS